MARPTKYTLEYVTAEARAFYQYVKDTPECLTVSEFIAGRDDYDPNRWAEWETKYGEDPGFSGAIKRGMALLESRIVKGAMLGDYNPTFSIFLLANKFGYSRADRDAPASTTTTVLRMEIGTPIVEHSADDNTHPTPAPDSSTP